MIRKYIYGPGVDQPVAMIHVDPQTQAEMWYYYGVYPGPDPGPTPWAAFA